MTTMTCYKVGGKTEPTFLRSHCHLGMTINHPAKTVSESAEAFCSSLSHICLFVELVLHERSWAGLK